MIPFHSKAPAEAAADRSPHVGSHRIICELSAAHVRQSREAISKSLELLAATARAAWRDPPG